MTAPGRADANPSTNARKGPITLDAVAVNQLRFSFMDQPVPRGARRPARAAAGRPGFSSFTAPPTRSGASSPYRFRSAKICISMPGGGAHPAGRDPLDGDLADAVPTPPPLPDITIDVKRRA